MVLDYAVLGCLVGLLQVGVGLVSAGVIGAIVAFCYFIGLEASPMQATLGKRVAGVLVTNLDHRKLGLRASIARTAAKCVSICTPLWLGYAVALFTTRSQTLHDLLAGTLVVRRRH